jgi:hypothetical protein
LECKTKIVSKEYWTKQHKINSRNVEIRNQQAKVKELCSVIENLIFIASKLNAKRSQKNGYKPKIDLYYNPKKYDAPAEIIPINLIEYFDYYIKEKTIDDLIRKYRVLQKKLMRFQTYRKKPILIKDVNKRFKLEFSDYDSEQYSRITTRDFAEVKTICIDARSRE